MRLRRKLLIALVEGLSFIVLTSANVYGKTATGFPPPEQNTSLFKRGFEHLSQFESDKAILCLAPLCIKYGGDLADSKRRQRCAQVLALIARAFQFDENDVAAEQSYQLSHILSPENKATTAQLAYMLSRVGRWGEAKTLFASVSQEATTNLEIALCLSGYFYRMSDDKTAEFMIRRALPHDKTKSRLAGAYWCLSGFQVRQKQLKPAAEYLSQAAACTTSPYLKKLFLARRLLYEQDTANGEELCREAGQILPEDPSWLTGLANLGGFAKPAPDQDVIFQERLAAVKCRRFSSMALNLLAGHLNWQKRQTEALQCLDYIKTLRPTAYEPYLWSVPLYQEPNDSARLEKELNTCLAFNPYCASAWVELADHVAKTKSSKDAVEVLEKGVSNCPNSPLLWTALGKTLFLSKRWPEAHQAYTKALALMPIPTDLNSLNIVAKKELADIYANVGTCDYKAKRLKEATKAAMIFNQCKFTIHLPGALALLRIRPDRLDFADKKASSELEHEALADMLYEGQELEDSVKEYRLALAEDPDNLELHTFLFFVLRETDDWRGTMSEDLNLSNKLITKFPNELGEALKKILPFK
jgi:tetratricopeptide (TPR) repeat protein